MVNELGFMRLLVFFYTFFCQSADDLAVGVHCLQSDWRLNKTEFGHITQTDYYHHHYFCTAIARKSINSGTKNLIL